jgi:ribonuclease-3
MPADEAGRLTQALGYRFSDSALLREALTHPSVDSRRSGSSNYQRLEFLGDRVLGLVMAEYLFNDDPGAREGDMAVRFNALVRRETVAEIATEIGLGAHLNLGRSEAEQGGSEKPAILADAMEAVIGGIFLDGGMDAARKVVLQLWRARLRRAEATGKDAKTRLQEWLQARGKALPNYEVVERTGPDHAPVFSIRVSGEGMPDGLGEGGSRREAEQDAAARVLTVLETERE